MIVGVFNVKYCCRWKNDGRRV